jgi:sulfide:quinone oxidoreductase
MSVAEPFQQGEVKRFPLARLASWPGGQADAGTLARLDLDKRSAETADGAELTGTSCSWRWAPGLAGDCGWIDVPRPGRSRGAREVVDDAVAGRVQSLTFALPTLAAWPLPLYELRDDEDPARGRGRDDRPGRPRHARGRAAQGVLSEASASIKSLLETRGIGLRTHDSGGVQKRRARRRPRPGDPNRASRVAAGAGRPADPGLPTDGQGFVRADEYGRVEGHDDVYAAGDITTFPLKQGGIATQQADAAAESIAALAGASVTPRPFKPVLRGLLLTGLTPRFMSASLLDDASEVDSEPLWWPPAKIVGRYLAPFLAQHVGLSAESPPEALSTSAVEVDVELERIEGDWVSDR